MTTTESKAICLAVDGMEPELTYRWVREEKLPNIESLIDRGVYGTASCSSLNSARQWTNHFTGLTPAEHGITGFRRSTSDGTNESISVDTQLINLNDINVKTYPELLDERGISVGLVNPLPLWPPLELTNGFCVSGLLTPPKSDRIVAPEEMQSDLETFEYGIDVRYKDRPYGFIDDELLDDIELETLKHDLFEVLTRRIEFSKHAMVEYDPDYFYVLLKSIDVLQHAFWAHMEQDAEDYGDTILEAYRLVDEFVGWVDERFPERNVMVFSDHGFQSRRSDPPSVVHSLAKPAREIVPGVPLALKRTYKRLFTREIEFDIDTVQQISGEHSDPAIWMMAGPDVNQNGRKRIAFDDITPILLALLDCPIPESYAGSPRSEYISKTISTDSISIKIDRSYRIDEDEVVSDRLHHLGYAEFVGES